MGESLHFSLQASPPRVATRPGVGHYTDPQRQPRRRPSNSRWRKWQLARRLTRSGGSRRCVASRGSAAAGWRVPRRHRAREAREGRSKRQLGSGGGETAATVADTGATTVTAGGTAWPTVRRLKRRSCAMVKPIRVLIAKTPHGTNSSGAKEQKPARGRLGEFVVDLISSQIQPSAQCPQVRICEPGSWLRVVWSLPGVCMRFSHGSNRCGDILERHPVHPSQPREVDDGGVEFIGGHPVQWKPAGRFDRSERATAPLKGSVRHPPRAFDSGR